MWFTGTDQFTMEELKYFFIESTINKLFHKELVITLGVRENGLVGQETKELVEENYLKYDGSPLGFYYKSQLFAVAATYKEKGIKPIAFELEDKAQYLKANRTDIPQYMIYMAHFLTTLRASTDDPVEYAANIPDHLSTFSHSMKQLENFVELHDAAGRVALKYDRKDPSKAIFFLHYDRVNEPLKRFLFRRITF